MDQIKTACADATNRELRIEQDISVGYRSDGAEPRKGALGQTVTNLLAVRKELEDQTKKAAALQATLASLKNEIDDAKDPATAEFAKSALKFCAADPSTATAAKAADAPPTLQQAFSQCITNAASKADPAVKAVKHFFLAEEIQSAISAVLTAQSNSASGQPSQPDPKVAASTTTALKTLEFLTTAADAIAANSQPSVNALLVALAYEQHQMAMVRRDSLQQAGEVATSWKNILQPALDELVAYGKGGLDQQTIVNLIIAAVNAGGFSAVAARVGK